MSEELYYINEGLLQKIIIFADNEGSLENMNKTSITETDNWDTVIQRL